MVFTEQDLQSEPLASALQFLETQRLPLNSKDLDERRWANYRIGLAVSFISVTPYTFAMEGR